MQDEEFLTPAEHELASALGGLQPAATSIDRDRLMFRAGRASVHRRGRLWQGATGSLALALAVSLVVRPAPRQVERIVTVAQAPRTQEARRVASMDADRWPRDARPIQAGYLRLRNAVLTHGVAALPTPHVSPARRVEQAESLEESLGIPAGTLNRPGLLGVRGPSNRGEQL